MTYKIAFFSFADIDNFGDILFSHIFKMEMEKRFTKCEIDFYTPTDYEVEGIKYFAYARERVENKYDALIVFGGEVVHLYDERTWLPIYAKNKKKLMSKLPSDVIFDWVDLDNVYKAWISVGVRPIDNMRDYLKISSAVESLSYVSTRGNISKKILEDNVLQYNNKEIEITPDLGWLFPELLDYTNSKGTYYKNYISANKYLIFQINNISEIEAEEISTYLLDFQNNTGIQVVLLPVIRPWEDYKYLKLIKETTENDFILLQNNLDILEIADILIHADLILTSSLHASITGLSAGIPSAIINKWQGTKLQDLWGHQFRLHMLRHELFEIPQLLKQLIIEKTDNKEILQTYSRFMKLKLNNVFDKLAISIMQNKTRS